MHSENFKYAAQLYNMLYPRSNFYQRNLCDQIHWVEAVTKFIDYYNLTNLKPVIAVVPHEDNYQWETLYISQQG
jgi:hypothetical protein